MRTPRILGLALIATAGASANARQPGTIVLWDFNGANRTDGLSPAPTSGSGVASLIGGTAPALTGAFAFGTGSTDPAVLNDFAWNIASFPAQGAGSGTAGIQFQTATTGRSSITFEFDYRAGDACSDSFDVQFSTNSGATWASFFPAGVPASNYLQAQGTTFSGATNDVGHGVPGGAVFTLPAAADNSPDVRVRIVSIFDPTSVDPVYSPNTAGTPSGYSAVAGTIRFDMVEFRGTLGGSPLPPAISGGVLPVSVCASRWAPIDVSASLTPGQNPASQSYAVTADLSAIGGSTNVPLAQAGALDYALNTTLPMFGSPGPAPILLRVEDDLGRVGTTSVTLTLETCCPADLDNDGNPGNGGSHDGGVDINDLLFFLSSFEAGSIAVDLDNDGEPTFGVPDGGIDINDLLFFLARFEGGC